MELTDTLSGVQTVLMLVLAAMVLYAIVRMALLVFRGPRNPKGGDPKDDSQGNDPEG